MKALQLLFKESAYAGNARFIQGGVRGMKYGNRVNAPKDNLSWKRVMNGVRWGGLAGGIGAAGYMANS